MIGTKLAHFEITAKLGEGGMGEVYRAEDTKLGREVAIKVLPEAVAADPERLARFEREAKVLASLNHLNIAGIHQIEEADGKMLLVMELVKGADLTEYIAQGPLPLERALPMALQITEALEAAHDRGIVHRDLKPANVKITPEGQVKVLDFGLAKALDPGTGPESSPSISLSPTLTAQMTQAGVLLGTAAYMSPEQARGENVDRRADIWAFGVVLMEMLTGERVYAGRTVSDTLASVLAREPDWEGLPDDLPQSIRSLLTRCLEKEPRERLQAIGEARLAIERYLADPEAEKQADAAELSAETPARRTVLPWLVAGLAVVAALVSGFMALRLYEQANQPPRLTRTVVLPPEGHDWDLDGVRPGRVAISPDGRQLAYSAIPEGGGDSMLWIRPLDSPVGRPLPSTEDAAYPFWSPDGRHVAFFAEGKLKKIAVAGGPPVSLCDASNGKSGSWNRQGTIIYTPEAGTALYRVPAAGGECVPITELDAETGDNSHRHPWFLPDDEHFLYLARRTGTGSETVLRVGSLDGATSADVIYTPTNAAYASGHLLFNREGTLMAQAFDPERFELSGEAVPLVERLLEVSGAALSVFAVSESGDLVYQTGSSTENSQLLWKSRTGEDLGPLGEPADQGGIYLSADWEWAAASIAGEDGQTDLWLYEVSRNLRSRFTFNGGFAAAWSPDRSRIAFSSDREAGTPNLYLKAVGGTGEAELLFANSNAKFPTGWTPDGNMVLFVEFVAGAGPDLWVIPVDGDRQPIALVASEFRENDPVVSPNGRWLAYSSDESGRREVYITTFPRPERKWQVSTGGGRQPVWTRDGGELVYVKDSWDVLYAAEVSSDGDSFRVGSVEKLFDVELRPDQGRDWDVTADGERFLLNAAPDRGRVSGLHVVMNWPAILEER